jgi:hypothetical protein
VAATIGTWQNLFQIRWKSSDLSILKTHRLTPGLRLATNTATTTRSDLDSTFTNPAGTDSATQGPASTTSATSPSTAAKAGIGVGAAIIAVLILACLFLLLRYYRSARLTKSTGDGRQLKGIGDPDTGMAELGDVQGVIAELGSTGATK